MTTVAPNPYSPFATADPNYRHAFGVFVFFGAPEPGVLTPTACKRLAVAPEEQLQTASPDDEPLPDGLCPDCVTVIHGGHAQAQGVTDCRACSSPTRHGDLCAVCRQIKHDEWWPTRDQQPTGRA